MCNWLQIDRVFALWQGIHPEVWVTSRQEEFGTFTVPPETEKGENTGGCRY